MIDEEVKKVISAIQKNNTIAEAFKERGLSSSFLNEAADCFELYGIAETKERLKKRKRRGRENIAGAKAILEEIEKSELIRSMPGVGRIIIKTIPAMFTSKNKEE
jgi:hypothetical protein